MATRSGDVDPSMVNFVAKKLNVSGDEIIDMLNHDSGLLGISGVSSDMRDVEVEANNGNERAKLALDINLNRVVKYIGSYMAELGGVDAVVFTAGVGENDANFRKQIADQLAFVGMGVDDEKNNVRGVERDISSADAKVKALLIPTDEELMIVRDIERLRNK